MRTLVEECVPRTATKTTDLATRILVVEDDADTRLGLTVNLRALGHEVFVGSDGLEAVQLARQLVPELVLLDLGLPKLHGLELLRGVRAAAPTARVIVFSAWDEQQYESAALDAGATLYIQKPVSCARLVAVINRLLA